MGVCGINMISRLGLSIYSLPHYHGTDNLTYSYDRKHQLGVLLIPKHPRAPTDWHMLAKRKFYFLSSIPCKTTLASFIINAEVPT